MEVGSVETDASGNAMVRFPSGGEPIQPVAGRPAPAKTGVQDARPAGRLLRVLAPGHRRPRPV